MLHSGAEPIRWPVLRGTEGGGLLGSLIGSNQPVVLRFMPGTAGKDVQMGRSCISPLVQHRLTQAKKTHAMIASCIGGFRVGYSRPGFSAGQRKGWPPRVPA